MNASVAPLRIAYVLLRPPSYSETFISSEIEVVRASGAIVEVFCARREGEGRAAQLGGSIRALLTHPRTVLRHLRILGRSYGPRALLASAYALRLRDQVSRFRPDVVHAHFVNLPTAVAVLVAQMSGLPVTAQAHAADFLLERRIPSLDRRLRRLSHLFLVSAAAADQLADRGVRMGEIPHSIVRASFDGSMVRSPGGGDRIPTLVTVARLIDKKGIDVAVSAVGLLTQRERKVHYDVYGDGPNAAALARQVAAAGLGDVIRLHGRTGHAEAMTALIEADVAVLACRRGADGDIDGIPVFLMEAASRGIPVVTTAVSGIPELLGEGGGWMVPVDDVASLADAVEDVLGRPEEARARTETLQRRVATEFSPRLQAERLIAVWSRL